ncbi:MAG: hypothetical protein BAJALOKI1v1_780005 [Promethearchaeota archaeon]|nr:MAG: hypothetical protein BAJALOKI1v1_780005 [Candidatus Lokiarchaeota archaeon]
MKNIIDGKEFVSTRHRDAEPDTFDPNIPRLGRRESEPHSAEITYLHDVLTTNFPEDRTIWDLHHYFKVAGLEIDIQFDLTYFKGLKIPYTLSSYHADKFDNKVPTMAINIMSKSTWRSDIAEKLDYCRLLEIPIYIIFPSYHVAKNLYKPPFVRVYILQENGEYKIFELRQETISVDGEWNGDAIIDVSEIVPFRIGLRNRDQLHEDEESLYRLILIDPEKEKVLLTQNEKKDQIIDNQKQTIDNQKQTIDNQKQTIDNQKQTFEDLKSKYLELKKKFQNG